MDRHTKVLVIGGGCVGTGILWDLSLRGVDALLIEKEDLAAGATGRCHGLLHSGGRYVVKDKISAKECVEENHIIKRIAAHCVEDTGGLFLQLKAENDEYGEQWIQACRELDMPAQELSPAEVFRIEPRISRKLRRAFKTADASIDPFCLAQSLARCAQRNGSALKTYTRVKGFIFDNAAVVGVKVEDIATGKEETIGCDLVINASGGGVKEIAAYLGVEIPIILNKGTLLVYNHRFVNHCLNYLRPPSDADVFVPVGSVVLLGTTSINVDSPDGLAIGQDEIEKIIAIGSEMVPSLKSARILRAFCGVRPLYAGNSQGNADQGRQVSRNFHVLDHAAVDNIQGILSIFGGKLTSYRVMAEKAVDLACQKLGISCSCQTKDAELRAEIPSVHAVKSPVSHTAVSQKTSERQQYDYTEIEKHWEQPENNEIICDCELVTKAELKVVADDASCKNLNDLRRRTRLGMGTCQGCFCGFRASVCLHGSSQFPDESSDALLSELLKERWKGSRHVLWGKQLQEFMLSRAIYSQSLGINSEVKSS